MIPTDFTISTVDWNNDAEREACRAVREQVFIIGQNVPREDEWDSLDATSRHVLARDLAGNPIGTGRLTPERKIGRMAVLADWRGRHVGEAIMNLLIEQARALGYREVELHAQTHAVPFYEKFGFVKYGDEFEECAIRHFHMRRELAPLAVPPPRLISPRPERRIVAIGSREDAAGETLRLIEAARHELCIYTRDLDPILFENEPALEALKRVAVSGRGASLRIIIQDPRAVVAHGHRLITLAQRLTSVFALRTPVEDNDLQYPSAFLLNDAAGYYFRTLATRFEGEAVNYAPDRHAQLLEYFNQVWERAEPSEELRLLNL
ncbi:MAG TPA: GNAT family N-acetyltransferase [Rudaea sp.]|nr:GNAT family N-acetyltransferase [Rudaea sp.]